MNTKQDLENKIIAIRSKADQLFTEWQKTDHLILRNKNKSLWEEAEDQLFKLEKQLHEFKETI